MYKDLGEGNIRLELEGTNEEVLEEMLKYLQKITYTVAREKGLYVSSDEVLQEMLDEICDKAGVTFKIIPKLLP